MDRNGKVVRLDPNDLRIIKRKGSNSVEAAHQSVMGVPR
jgi:hypothetical protein